MPIQADKVYKTHEEIVSEVLAAWVARIPDVGITPDTIVRIWTEVFANSVEGAYLGMQLMHDDMFIQTMSSLALARAGEQYGRMQKSGTLATGSVRFSGAAGEYIDSGTQVGSPRPALGDTLIFETTDAATIPSPGDPDAPTVADASVSGNLTGTIEWAVTFTTTAGETEIGTASDALTLSSSQADLSDIPVGGTGTAGRKIYRRNNGGDWKLVHTITNNTDTTYTDNIADNALAGAPPDQSTAEQITVTAQAVETGTDYNVGIGAISVLVNANADITSVTNAAAFTGGSDDEATEVFRQELLKWVRAPKSGAPDDLIAWATSIDGVDSASAYPNKDLADADTPGTVAIRIAGPDGSVPDSDKVDEVQDYLDARDLAVITIVVGTFTPLTVTVEVTVTIDSDYALADVQDSIEQAIIGYVNSVPIGGTVYIAGLYHAIFSLPGVLTLTVDDPTTDTAAQSDEKPVTTTTDITVNEA